MGGPSFPTPTRNMQNGMNEVGHPGEHRLNGIRWATRPSFFFTNSITQVVPETRLDVESNGNSDIESNSDSGMVIRLR